MKNQKEFVFQLALAKAFESRGHRAALCDAGTKLWPTRFSSDGLKPDLLVRLYPGAKTTKIVGIETKTDGPRSISETLDGAEKVVRLALEKPTYRVWSAQGSNGVSGVKEYYLATPLSLTDSVLCRWEDVWSGRKWTEESHRYFTVTLDMLLKRFGCGLLLKGAFGISFSSDWEKTVDF